jgi:raffinose/stachyose/melibiose transport system permease protein
MKTKHINLVLEIILWLFSFIIIYPLMMVVMTSFKTKAEANYLNIKPPKIWQFGNFKEVLQANFFKTFQNSLFITIISVVLIIIFSSILGYLLVRRNTRGCRLIYRFITFGIIAPFAALPTIQLLKMLGMYGTRFSICLVYTALFMPFTVMMFSGFIKTIPRELDEAAIIDGLAGFGLFFRIVFPLLKPVLATTGVLNFMWVWNELQIPLYLTNSSSKWTLPLSVYNFYGQFSRNWNLVCADVVLVSLPVVFVYIFAQKYIISGMTAGAVKG